MAQASPGQKLGDVREVHVDHLESLNVLPVCVYIVTYRGVPRNVWANAQCLQILDVTLHAFCDRDLELTGTDYERSQWINRFTVVEEGKEPLLERNIITHSAQKQICVETACSPCVFIEGHGDDEKRTTCCMVTQWPLEVKSKIEAHTSYQTALLESSPYPLCFFSFDGHLITCNPAAVSLFGQTIWLQSDIFGMGEFERLGLNSANSAVPAPTEKTERRTAYENMMDALAEEGSVFQVDLPIKRDGAEGPETWYCRVFAQRQTDPVTGEPIIMVSHQDVTNLRKVEGELGRMLMTERTNKELKEQHDTDVAGSLLTLLGESGWQYEDEKPGSSPGTPRTASTATADTAFSSRMMQLNGLRQCLDSADNWAFDVFELERESDGLPLQVLTWHVFNKHNLIDEFNLDHVKLVQFLRQVESNQMDNPYHNATHVADVVQSTHCLLIKGGLDRFVGKLEVLAALLAATIHDFEHKGFNNDFLIKTSDDWAIDSNDKSPNEHHHLSAAFRLLRQPDCDFLHRMPHHQQQAVRKMVIDMVLATDMAEHMAIVSRLKSDLQKRLENPDDDLVDGGDIPESLKTLVLQAAIKLADTGHLFADNDVHVKWSVRLEEEMWRQGDVEVDVGMKVSFLMDRNKPGVTKSQPGFLDFVIRPLFETWVACFPECKVLTDRIESNYQYWKAKERQEIEESAAAAAAKEADSAQDKDSAKPTTGA
mmetsp:Transcript_7614/g.14984  ORF Transcript_7614/g.14984 Transcript_7614/m.14984 type:complete len:710 (-) Transcript_7614:20-2149(-)